MVRRSGGASPVLHLLPATYCCLVQCTVQTYSDDNHSRHLPALMSGKTHKLLALQVTPNHSKRPPPKRPPSSKTTFVRLRKRVQSKHILGGLKINWGLIEQHLWMDGSPMLSRVDLENQPHTRGVTERGGDHGRNAETHSGGVAPIRLLHWLSACLLGSYGETLIINHTLTG